MDFYDDRTSPTYREASDPKSRYFDPDWYKKSLPPDDDPWYHIIGEFCAGQEKIEELLKDKFAIQKHISMEQGMSDRSFDIAELAIGEAASLLGDIEKKIAFKEMDVDFIVLWGEFQKNIGIASSKYSELLSLRKRGKYDRKVADNGSLS